MKAKDMLLSVLLTAVLGAALLAAALVDIFAPAVILPKLDIVSMVLLSLVALVLDAFIAPNAKRCYVCVFVFSAISFGLLPWAAGLAAANCILLNALIGGAVFTIVTLLFSSALDRMNSGKRDWRTIIVTAVGFFLAAQAFTGIVL